MKLRTQGIWLAASATAGFFALVALVAGLVLLPAADSADRHAMLLRLSRLNSRMAHQMEEVRVYANEYGPWTDTVEFIAGQKPGFIEDNLNPDQLRGAKINVVAIWDAGGRRVVATAYDPETGKVGDLPADSIARIEAWSGLAQREVGRSREGVIRDAGGLLVFSVQPVTRNDRLPPSLGTFFAGHRLNQALLTEMTAGEDHQAELRSRPADSAATESADPVRFTNADTLTGTMILRDPEGAVVGEIVLTAPRYARQVEKRSLALVFGALGVGGVALVSLLWAFFSRRFLHRIESLTETVKRLEGDPAARARLAAARGADELAQLARDTGAMAVKLADARAAAESATRAKGDFLAAMSHEIRTPLNGVIGYLGLLRDTPLTAEQSEHVRIIEESGETLIGVINEILDFSKLESGKVELEAIPTDVAKIADEVMALFLPRLRDKSVTGSVRVADGAPARLAADPLRVRQVLNNLVSNAIKFTLSGEVSVRIEPLAAGGDRREGVRVSVRDTGIGMTEGQQEGLFQPFAQADSSTSRRYGGTGLGLAICMRLVRAWGGELTATSRVGEGSTFTFTLPAPALAAPEPKAVPAASAAPASPADKPGPRQAPLRILMAEDNAVNSRLLLAILRRLGHAAEHVVDGRKALAAMDAREFDLVLMDVQMPELDGLAATRRQRERERAEGRRPVLIAALTANALPGAREECMEAGMDDYLPKPFQIEQVRSLLKRAEARARQAV